MVQYDIFNTRIVSFSFSVLLIITMEFIIFRVINGLWYDIVHGSSRIISLQIHSRPRWLALSYLKSFWWCTLLESSVYNGIVENKVYKHLSQYVWSLFNVLFSSVVGHSFIFCPAAWLVTLSCSVQQGVWSLFNVLSSSMFGHLLMFCSAVCLVTLYCSVQQRVS